MYAVREQEAALDLVQDAMLKLAEKYGDRPIGELPLLFQRILQNLIRDYYRRSKVRSAWSTLFSPTKNETPDNVFDPLEHLLTHDPSGLGELPDDRLQQRQVMQQIEMAIAALPLRQREAFLLRYWEGLDVAETAEVMGCAEGSVKTHCSRATHALALQLQRMGIKP